MDIAMEVNSEFFRMEEWTIENFTCWNKELHGEKITTSKSLTFPDFSTELYPKGIGGNDERLVVRICCSEPMIFRGELSFVAPDGSLLCKQQVDSKEKLNVFELPPGPKFEGVVSRIRETEDLHGDYLTLKHTLNRPRNSEDRRITSIVVFEASYRLSPGFSDHLADSTYRMISTLKYPCDDEEIQEVFLGVAKVKNNPDTKLVLAIDPDVFRRNASVVTRMTVQSNEEVIRIEHNEHMFRDDTVWSFSDSLTLDEVVKNKLTLILRFKIIPGGKCRQGFGSFQNWNLENVVRILPPARPCGIGISEENISKSANPVTSIKVNDSVAVLTNELMCLYQDQDFSDFTLKCDGISIPVHRNILSARSPVFKTMLSTDMTEAASGQVDIGDLDPSTLARFLAFLYTGGVEDLQCDIALKLYYAADKYQVPSLKKECSDVLCENVSVSSVCDVLSLGDKHGDDRLTSAARAFVLKNYNEVLKSEEWKNFLKNDPLLAAETVTFFAENDYVGRKE